MPAVPGAGLCHVAAFAERTGSQTAVRPADPEAATQADWELWIKHPPLSSVFRHVVAVTKCTEKMFGGFQMQSHLEVPSCGQTAHAVLCASCAVPEVRHADSWSLHPSMHRNRFPTFLGTASPSILESCPGALLTACERGSCRRLCCHDCLSDKFSRAWLS